jgi:hypothetical protein
MTDLDTADFDERLRAGLRQAARSLSAPDGLDDRFARRIAQHRRRSHAAMAIAATVAVAVVAAGVGVTEWRHAGATHLNVTTGPPNATGPTSGLPGGVGQWTALPPAPIEPRMQDLTLWTGSLMLIWGGGSGNPNSSNDGATYHPATNRWAKLPAAPIAGRVGSVGVWTGQQALIFGGTTSSSQPGDGAAYDPATRQWRHLPASPLGNLTDSGSYVAWTGSVMLAWGFFGTGTGSSHGGGSRAVGIFDPATDHWSVGAMAALDAPIFGDAFWTGSELIVVGATDGSGSTTSQNPIAVAYNPATNTWRALPPPPLPGGRENMLTAWDGTELIIGGGYGAGQGPWADATAYNPSTNTWRHLPNAPEGFTGNNRYPDVWDGHDVVTLQDHDSHGRPLLLDPTTGKWSFGPPQPVAHLTETPAIWTGHEIIQWGGGTAYQDGTATGCCHLVKTGAALSIGP